MILWKKEFIRPAATDGEVIFKRHECEWILPLSVARVHLKFNPRHLPVVIGKPSNEDYYLRLSIRRIVCGYRALRTFFPPSPFVQE